MMEQKMIDHLFRHQFGKMVSILTRIFGLSNLQTIEDAVQDTFIMAMVSWRNKMPDNPEAWLTKAAKNRTIDLFRKLNAEQKRIPKFDNGAAVISLFDLFLENEIEDSQLRMIFTACHPSLKSQDQISFALKTISGFSSKEIASALLQKEETIKKRLSRARKVIKDQALSFEIPSGKDLPERLNIVMEVLYLLFNEGFHSNRKKTLIRQELCGEAIRLTKMLCKHEFTKFPAVHALFALMCFQAARLPSKLNEQNEIIDLKNQDRSLWYFPLVRLGNEAMLKAVESENFTSYHFEAAIAAEHLKAKSFEKTNWDLILNYYQKLNELEGSAMTKLNIAVVQLQREAFDDAYQLLQNIQPSALEQRAYLYYGAYAEYYAKKGALEKAIESLDEALSLVRNEAERQFLQNKKAKLLI